MCGFLALVIDCWIDYQKGKDIKAKDIPYIIIGICFGTFALLFIILIYLKKTDAVLIKGKDLSKADSKESSELDLKKNPLEEDIT